jgi:peptide subunit release factor 1 (eRF1)
MAIFIKVELECPKCGYREIKEVSDAEIIKIHFISCPKCGEEMKVIDKF